MITKSISDFFRCIACNFISPKKGLTSKIPKFDAKYTIEMSLQYIHTTSNTLAIYFQNTQKLSYQHMTSIRLLALNLYQELQ